MSAANMDKEVFEDPFTLNIHRPNNKKHLTFGSGPHFCLGAPLAEIGGQHRPGLFMDHFRRIEPIPGFKLEEHLTPSAAGQTLASYRYASIAGEKGYDSACNEKSPSL
ncbi:cytochrome P450 [Paenibacillus sp. JTLBN-2024]